MRTHRALSGMLLALLVITFFVVASGMHYEEDISKFLPSDDASRRYEEVYENVGNQNRIAILFTCRDSLSSDVSMMEDAMERFNELRGTDLEDVETSGSDVMSFVSENYPLFLTDADYQRIESLLSSPDYVKQKMELVKQTLLLPTGGMSMMLLKNDPLGLFSGVMQRMRSLQFSKRFTLIDGYLFSSDGTRSMLTMESSYGASESNKNSQLAMRLDSIAKVIETEFPEIEVSSIGAPIIAAGNANQIKRDSAFAVILSVILILALLIYHYRRWSDIAWIVVSLGFGWLMALAGMRLFTDSVSIIVLGIGSVIIGICVNYPLHFLDHLKELGNVRQTLKEMIAPLLIGNITTVAAFLCLVWLDAQAMRDLGAFGSLMLVGTILFVLVFLPVWVKGRKWKKEHEDLSDLKLNSTENASNNANDANQKPQTSNLKPQTSNLKLAAFLLLITLVLGWFSLKTSFDSDLHNINYMTDRQRADLKWLAESTSEASLYAVSEAEDTASALEANEKLVAALMQCDDIDGISGVGNFLPSQARQAQAIERWNAFCSEHKQKLMSDFASECQRQGFSSQAFEPFVKLMNTNFAPLSLQDFSPLTRILAEAFIMKSSDGSKVRVVNRVYERRDIAESGSETIKKVVENLNNQHADYFAFTPQDISNRLVSVLNDSFNYIGFVCGFVVFFFLWVSFGRIELSLASFLPLAVSWIWILGLMQIFGVRFNIVNIILATFIFGQGDDYTIFITEGLVYEYAYGRPRLKSYKRSVAFSAIIMFIGIGTLIFARHPALRSLAEVTIIGMLTVVLMAYYLPPLVFRWITTRGGKVRQVPLTLKRIGYSLFAMSFFLFMMCCVLRPYTWLYFHVRPVTERRRERYHQLLQRIANFVIHRVPGVKFRYENPTDEQFNRPAVMICNHQSHLDMMCIMMLTPKVVCITNKWAWDNPFYGAVIHQAEFLTIADGIDKNLPRLRSLYERGYSICIFPEGTRSEDCKILRFHKGAFYLAEKLGADIIPIYLHGAGHVLPKRDFMLREGQISVEVGKRIGINDHSMGHDDRTRRSLWHKHYVEHYAEMCRKLEDAEYCSTFVKYQYMYKGTAVEAHSRKVLNNKSALSAFVDDEKHLPRLDIFDAGQGELAFVYAMSHPETQVFAHCSDEDDYLLLMNMANAPDNLHVIKDEK